MFQTSGNKLYSNRFDHFLPEETQNLASQRKDRQALPHRTTADQSPTMLFPEGLATGKS